MIIWFLKHYFKWHAQIVQNSLIDPQKAQSKTLKRLQKILKHSEQANSIGFHTCKTLEELRSLPKTNSETLKASLNKIFNNGETDKKIFGSAGLIAFARTSGTLGDPKDIPINKAYLKSLERTLTRMMASFIYSTGEWKLLGAGKHVLLASRPMVGTSPTGLPIADISGLIPTLTRKYLRGIYSPCYQDLWIKEWSKRMQATIDHSHGKNIVSISGIPALALDFVEQVREKNHGLFLDQIWPNLRFYIYGAVHLSLADREKIKQTWCRPGHNLHFVETYFSTEAPIAYSYDANHFGLALNLTENLYLFRCYQQADQFFFAHELSAGQYYSIYITTPGGLINYSMGDKIEVLSTRPLLIKVAGRDKEELSMTGEKITLAQLDLALNSLEIENKLSFKPVVWIDHSEKLSHLVWGFPEFYKELLSDTSSGAFNILLDDALCRFNILYAEALREEKVIGPSQTEFIPENVFKTYYDSKLGIGQFKPKRIFQTEDEFTSVYNWKPHR